MTESSASENPGPTLAGHARDRKGQGTPTPASHPRAVQDPGGTTDTTLLDSATAVASGQALEASSVGRLRVMAGTMLSLVIVGFIAASTFEAEPFTRRLAQGALILLGLEFAYVAVRVRQTRQDEARKILLDSFPIMATVVVANLAFGLLSPFGIAVALGLLLFSSSTTRAVATTGAALMIGGYMICASAVHWGVYTHKPLFTVRFAEPWMWLVAALLVCLLHFVAFLAGRLIRREQTRAVAKLEVALREASMRDALLREAREAFQQAAGLGAAGRFTDQVLDGFKLGAVIGRGGMGEVYAAERLADGGRAAVKLLRSDAPLERATLLRFERETRIVAAVTSTNVVKVFGVSGPDSPIPYIAMEHLHGVDLAKYLRERPRMPLAEVSELVAQLSVGLGAAHAANVVHRDLKPNNVFRSGSSERPVWKVLDFGVSKWMDTTEQTLTVAELVGTPQYMAPEQTRAEPSVDQTVDVYALTAIAYRALTGEPPFAGKMPAILMQIARDTPRPPSSFVKLPEQVDHVFSIGLAKDPRVRFQSASELSACLQMAMDGRLPRHLIERAQVLEVSPREAKRRTLRPASSA